MTDLAVRAAILEELASRGCALSDGEHDLDLISAGVNSATLIDILSALEDRFDVDLASERLFAEPVTVPRIEAELLRLASA